MVVKLLAVMGPDFSLVTGIQINTAFGSHKGFINPVVGIGIVTAFTVNNGAVVIGKTDAVVVKYLTMVLAGPYHTAPGSFGFYGVRPLHPVGHVNVVYMLFDDMVSAQPVKVIPVSHLVFHLSLTALPWSHPHAAGIPVHLSAKHVANGPVIYPVDGFNI